MYFLHTMQKGISRWGSCVLQRIIDFKTQTKLFNIFVYLCYSFFTFSMNLFFITYCYNFKRIQWFNAKHLYLGRWYIVLLISFSAFSRKVEQVVLLNIHCVSDSTKMDTLRLFIDKPLKVNLRFHNLHSDEL
jgi:hypothetical protein